MWPLNSSEIAWSSANSPELHSISFSQIAISEQSILAISSNGKLFHMEFNIHHLQCEPKTKQMKGEHIDQEFISHISAGSQHFVAISSMLMIEFLKKRKQSLENVLCGVGTIIFNVVKL